MDSLGPLLSLLGQAKEGKLTVKELVALLEAAIIRLGNAAAHLSMERRKSLMKYLNRDLNPIAEGYFPDGPPCCLGMTLLAWQNPQPTM